MTCPREPKATSTRPAYSNFMLIKSQNFNTFNYAQVGKFLSLLSTLTTHLNVRSLDIENGEQQSPETGKNQTRGKPVDREKAKDRI